MSLRRIAAVAVALVAAAAPATASARGMRAPQRPHTAPATDYSRVWTDATLDCYPPGGGIVGGGPNNNSVSLAVNWHSPDGRNHTVRHYVWFEEYRNNRGPNWVTPDNGSAARTPAYGPFHMTPSGTTEFVKWYRDPFSGGQYSISSPWTRTRSYPKSVRVTVRAMIGLQYLNARGWGAITWLPAQTAHAATGYKAGFCAL